MGRRRANVVRTQARPQPSTRGRYVPPSDTSGLRGFRGRGDPLVPRVPSQNLDGKEGVTVRAWRRPGLVAWIGDKCAYGCAYRLVSARCYSPHLVAASRRLVRRHFQFAAARCSSFGRTFNPKVAGSIPARPTRFAGLSSRHASQRVRVCLRHAVRAGSNGFNTLLFVAVFRGSLQFVSVCPMGFWILGILPRRSVANGTSGIGRKEAPVELGRITSLPEPTDCLTPQEDPRQTPVGLTWRGETLHGT
jgi:hypothetical protein